MIAAEMVQDACMVIGKNHDADPYRWEVKPLIKRKRGKNNDDQKFKQKRS